MEYKVDINAQIYGQYTFMKLEKNEVEKKLSDFILKESSKLNLMLNEFDKLEDMQKSRIIKVIEDHDDVSELSIPYTKEEVKFALEIFLRSVFIDFSSPIFSEGMEEERDISLQIALEYLNRFVYKVSRGYLFDDTFIITLENGIAKCNSFRIINATSELCYAKNILLDRVARRNILGRYSLKRELKNNKLM